MENIQYTILSVSAALFILALVLRSDRWEHQEKQILGMKGRQEDQKKEIDYLEDRVKRLEYLNSKLGVRVARIEGWLASPDFNAAKNVPTNSDT